MWKKRHSIENGSILARSSSSSSSVSVSGKGRSVGSSFPCTRFDCRVASAALLPARALSPPRGSLCAGLFPSRG